MFVPEPDQQAKTSHESVRNAGASIVAPGMLTPGVLAEIKKKMAAASAKAEREEGRMYRGGAGAGKAAVGKRWSDAHRG